MHETPRHDLPAAAPSRIEALPAADAGAQVDAPPTPSSGPPADGADDLPAHDRRERRTSLELPRSLRGVLPTLGAVAAPPTAVIGIAYYFSVKRQETLAHHFGIDNSLLGYSTQDYLLRGADAIFLLLLFSALVGLVAIQLHLAVMRAHDGPHTVWLMRVSVALRVVGAVLLVAGLAAVFRPLPVEPHFVLRSLSFGIGIVLIAYGVYLAGTLRSGSAGSERSGRAGREESGDSSWMSSVSVVLVAVVLLLSVFWTTKDLAQALGRDQARDLERALATRPAAVVYSDRRLHIDASDVTETRLAGEDGYRFRYAGLRLLVRSGGNYFLVPDSWSRSDGVVVVLPDTDMLRVEFSPGGR